MKVATIIFLIIAILEVAVLGLMSGAVVFEFADLGDVYEEGATIGNAYVDFFGSIAVAVLSIITLVRVFKAKSAVQFRNWLLYVATVAGVLFMGILSFTFVAYVLANLLKDKHFGYVPATSTSTTEEDAYEKLMQLKELYESGAITEEEYIAEKAKIMK